jgi:hypothetical protein
MYRTSPAPPQHGMPDRLVRSPPLTPEPVTGKRDPGWCYGSCMLNLHVETRAPDGYLSHNHLVPHDGPPPCCARKLPPLRQGRCRHARRHHHRYLRRQISHVRSHALNETIGWLHLSSARAAAACSSDAQQLQRHSAKPATTSRHTPAGSNEVQSTHQCPAIP